MSQSFTSSETYSVADIENVIRKVTADFIMIAESTRAVEVAQARKWAHDVELLARHGYLRYVDLTLLSYGIEVRALRYVVKAESGGLESQRPGGVLWPQVAGAHLRIVISYTAAYDRVAREKLRTQLQIPWSTSTADISHTSLGASAGRDYASNGYGIQRQDFS